MKNLTSAITKIPALWFAGLFFLLSIDSFAQRGRGGFHGAGGGMHRTAGTSQMRQTRETAPAVTTRPGSNNSGTKINRSYNNSNSNNRTNTVNRNSNTINRNNISNRNTNISGQTRNNNINRNRDININYNRNTIVRRNTVIYTRPPYVYGGYRYNTFHPYYYHPYRPYYWGPVWHPWGFFVATLAVTAIVVSVESTQYHYDQGVWYAPSNGGYQVVPAPVGGTVNSIPGGAQTVNTGTVNNYYYGGTYYEKEGSSYKVVPPTAGTLVDNLPEGGKEVTVGDVKYIKFGETYYQPVQVDGKNKYEVVMVEEDKK